MIELVVVEHAQKLDFLFRLHLNMLNGHAKTKNIIVLGDKIRINYLTPRQFDTWSYGKIFMFLEHYLLGRDIFYHGHARITKDQLAQLLGQGPKDAEDGENDQTIL